jgi:hypothetical protein
MDWNAEIKKLKKQIAKAKTPKEKEQLTRVLHSMEWNEQEETDNQRRIRIGYEPR